MNMTPLTIVLQLTSYLIGSTMSAIWIAKLFKLPDPRSYGSKNPGATNMARGKNKIAAFLTFSLDIFKGFAICYVLQTCGYDDTFVFLCGSCAVLGHMFPIFHKFEGGKGAATFFGVILAINATCGLIAFTIWATHIALFRNTGLSAVITAIANPILISNTTEVAHLAILSTIMGAIVIIKHKQNIIETYKNMTKESSPKPSNK
ncbi:MAG: glycerol-3-phosphate 1-O-acyltransferase PlsY [Pseudomonadota bacterium]|nr:glycerol-3-phosphate 1-O-acyltransferase PlsY [Pseudomonadota bacterium]